MDASTLDRYRTLLEQERDTDRARLDEIEVRDEDAGAHEMEAGEAGDAHRSKATRQQEEQRSLVEETEQRLDAIERALTRVEDGTYGTCEVCGADIATERLDALPMTASCIEHAPTEDDQPSDS